MFDFSTFNLGLWQWIALFLCAFMIGLSKTCIPGVSILSVPLMASVLPARESVGVVLPMLIFADCFAIAYYHRHTQWKDVLRLIPWTLVGLAVGYTIMDRVNDDQLKPIIGVIVLVMLGIWYWKNRSDIINERQDSKVHPAFVAVLGFAIGIATILANAAGPITSIYLLSLALPKNRFIGTGAWFIFIINWVKVPLNLSLGLITMQSLKLDLVLFPFILVGVVVGIILLKRIPQKLFIRIIMLLAAAAAIKLIF